MRLLGAHALTRDGEVLAHLGSPPCAPAGALGPQARFQRSPCGGWRAQAERLELSLEAGPAMC